jgi:hypothetical protein
MLNGCVDIIGNPTLSGGGFVCHTRSPGGIVIVHILVSLGHQRNERNDNGITPQQRSM